ncbi:SRPBCC family protein [Niabella hirudinis]|uniref:SRPBCC family protein n=1 Tax=Niabella hirudinis TaxID=1285929 RepID=UPI003EBF8431
MKTLIKADPETCFDLSRSIDLHRFSTVQTGERAVAGKTTGLIGAGETVTWQARHFGVRQKLTSKITMYDQPFHFRDEQLKGAFRFMKHDHYFNAVEGGTLMKDVFEFQSPLGILGQLTDAIIMKGYLTRFLTKRNRVVKDIAESGMGTCIVAAERKQDVRERAGAFSYTPDGFIPEETLLRAYYAWADVETIFAYKKDLVTTDEICLDLFTKKGIRVFINESLPGWDRFLQKLSERLPLIPEGWEWQVAQPPFETNLTLLFDRRGRTLKQAATGCYEGVHRQ